MKKALSLVLALILVASFLAIPVSASGTEKEVLRWSNTSSVICGIVFQEGNDGDVEAVVGSKYYPRTITIDVVVYRQSGNSWLYVTEGHVTKTAPSVGIECHFAATSGVTYKADFVITVSGATDEVLYFSRTETCP